MAVVFTCIVYIVPLMVMSVEGAEGVDVALVEESTRQMSAGDMLVLEQVE